MEISLPPETDKEEAKHYLQELANDLSYPDAAEAFGFARRSYHSMREYYGFYGVEVPNRVNGYEKVEESAESPVTIVKLNRAERRKLNVQRAVTISDLHIPFHDSRCIAVMLSVIEDLQPEVVFLAGDICDMYALSRFNKNPIRALQLDDERNQTVSFLAALREVAPNSRIVYVMGNHEIRMQVFLDAKCPELARLPEFEFERFFHLDEYGIELVKPRGKTAYTKFGPIKIGHFDRVNKQSAYTAKLLMDDYNCDLQQGHTHRLGTHYRTVADEPMKMACETGCGCLLNPEYVCDPNWQHGMVVTTLEVDNDRYSTTQIPIVDYTAVYNDIRYDG